MRFVKVLALVVGSVLLIPVSVLLIAVVFQSLLSAAAMFILLFGVGGIYRIRAADRAILNVRQSATSPDQAESLAFYGTRMAGVTAWVGPDEVLRETPRYSDHILTGGTWVS
jgi:hypothetical protein